MSEHIPIEENLSSQQQTLMWNKKKYLQITPGEKKIFHTVCFLMSTHRISFPSIYLGRFRKFRERVNARVTPYMIATSELRRSDRGAVTPYHVLYVATEIMRLRVRDSFTIAFQHVEKDTEITRKQIEDEDYVINCIEKNPLHLIN
ncbi:ATP-dependent DNA helicase [Trichonephila inaurata madagascariensis]|uniref:ATP-dependent DNA helicase n=1 Tax=Trichonephila inaurata madagascariensis TaxID=2747483 RepID=A0A8X6XS82_9ARAC|nr:ATP-dependent DNA helicase [Trichonephila inaurata madagascariensis]